MPLKGSRRRPKESKSTFVDKDKIIANQQIAAILSYIIQHSEQDKRPYLKVTVFGIELIGRDGWKIL